MTWPDHLLARAVRRPDLDLGIISGSTPVVSFGDPVESWVATLGINPSWSEFLDESGSLLDGRDRRLATLGSLGVERYEDLTPDHAVAIVDDCASYFERRPYKWFQPLDQILTQALGASYADRTACHLDLVQWATRLVWGILLAEDQDQLLRQDVGFLRKQLTTLGHQVILVNGKSVMSSVERTRLVRWQPVATLTGPPDATFAVGGDGGTRFLGWTCNLQSQHGASRHVEELAELVARHAGAGRRPADASDDRRVPTKRSAVGRGRASAQPSRSPSPAVGRAGDGLVVQQGLRFTSKGELVSYLTTWLERSSHDTIGGLGTYGGSVWITVESEAGPIGINRDTTREAVEALVDAASTRRSYDWLVVANRNGRVNRVLFSEERTPGWYAYLAEPLVQETRLGASRAVAASSPTTTPRPAPDHGGESMQPPGPVEPPVGQPNPPAPARPPTDAVPGRQMRTQSGTRTVTGGRGAIVQFPHPGGEHVPPGSHMGWNSGSHKRKFLVSPGRFIDAAGQVHADRLVFWGEWEAQSRVVHRWPAQPDRPTVLHEPYWLAPSAGPIEWQNTDPWVFGDRFLYSNCKQHTSNQPDRQPSALQRLPRGSVILFGSGRQSQFVIDTVFVVAGTAGAFVPAAGRGDLPIDDAFEVCTRQRLAGYAPHIAGSDYTLIKGATPDDPVDGMFSFVPCRVDGDADMRFARPVVDLPGIVNPKSTQSPSGAKEMRPLAQIVDAWRTVVDQVRRVELELGIHFKTPPRGDHH